MGGGRAVRRGAACQPTTNCLLADLIAAAVPQGSLITVKEDVPSLMVNGQPFAYAEGMIDELNFALTHFALSWQAAVAPGSRQLSTTLKALDNGAIPVSADGWRVDGSKGTYFTWSIDGNGNWEGTAGTQSMSYAIASFPDGWNMAIVLDRAAGTLHCVGRGVGQHLDENPVSRSITIRGNSNALSCTDTTNSTVLSSNLQGGDYLVCPM